MDEKKVDITKYPEGLHYLAQQLMIPLPPAPLPEDMPQEQKDAILLKQKEFVVEMLVGTLVRQ